MQASFQRCETPVRSAVVQSRSPVIWSAERTSRRWIERAPARGPAAARAAACPAGCASHRWSA